MPAAALVAKLKALTDVGGLTWVPLAPDEATATPAPSKFGGLLGQSRGRFVAPPPRSSPVLTEAENRAREQVVRELEELRLRNETVAAQRAELERGLAELEAQHDDQLKNSLAGLLRPEEMSNANELADIDAALEAKRNEIRSLEERSKMQETALQERDRMLRQREEEMVRLRQSRETDANTRATDLAQQEQLYRRDMELRRRQQLELEERRHLEADHRRRLAEDEARRRQFHLRAPPHLAQDSYIDPRGHPSIHALPPGPPPGQHGPHPAAYGHPQASHHPPAHPPAHTAFDPYAHLRPPPHRTSTFPPMEPPPPPHIARWFDRIPGIGATDLSAHGFGPVPASNSANLPADILHKFPVLTTETVPGFQINRVIGTVMGSSTRPVHAEVTEPQMVGIRAHNDAGRKAAILDMVAAAINERATAIVGLRFDCSAPISSHLVEVCALGTAVTISTTPAASKGGGAPAKAKGDTQADKQGGGKKGKQKNDSKKDAYGNQLDDADDDEGDANDNDNAWGDIGAYGNSGRNGNSSSGHGNNEHQGKKKNKQKKGDSGGGSAWEGGGGIDAGATGWG